MADVFRKLCDSDWRTGFGDGPQFTFHAGAHDLSFWGSEFSEMGCRPGTLFRRRR